MTVTIGTGADDGAPREGDNVVGGVETVLGTAGPDVMAGSGAAERLEGRDGDDRLDGRGGNDVIVGGLGDDAMAGGDGDDVLGALSTADGADVFQGGRGTDRADFGGRTVEVVLDADGRADDGVRPGGPLRATGELFNLYSAVSVERDNVLPDVEGLRGGRGDDVLGASATGGRLEGQAGTDVLFGGPGTDRLDGGAGFDRLAARDQRADTLVCGRQADRVFTDGRDTVGRDCEARSASFGVGLLIGDRLGGTTPLLRVRVVCPPQAATRCVGAVRAATVRRLRTAGGRRRTADLGSARFNAPAGGAVAVDIVLTAAGRAALERLGRTRVRVSARGRDEAGPGRPVAARRIVG